MNKFTKIGLGIALMATLAVPAVFVTGCGQSQYQIELNTSSSIAGNVYGDGSYASGEEIYIYAVANDGFEFVAWSDNNTENPRKIKVDSDKELTATFGVEQEEITYALQSIEVIGAPATIVGNEFINGTPYYGFYVIDQVEASVGSNVILENDFSELNNDRAVFIDSFNNKRLVTYAKHNNFNTFDFADKETINFSSIVVFMTGEDVFTEREVISESIDIYSSDLHANNNSYNDYDYIATKKIQVEQNNETYTLIIQCNFVEV